MFKNKTFYGVVGTAIILLTLGIYASGKSRLTNKSTSPTPSPTIVAKNVPEGWNTYSSNSLGFAIGRPADMEAVEHSDKTVTFVLLGLNQSKEADLTNATSVGEIKEVSYAERNGFLYSVNSSGNFDLIFLPIDENNYLQITVLVADPGNLGFEEIAQKILETLTMSQFTTP